MLTRMFALGLGLAACGGGGDETGSATLQIKISGEAAAQSGYPVGSGESAIAFSDGWSLKFSHVVVSLAGFDLQTSGGDDAKLSAEPVVADLHLGEPQLWKFENVAAKRWDRVGFQYVPPTSQSRQANAVDQDVIDRMSAGGYSFYVEATAHKDDREVKLQFGFPFSLQLARCENGQDGTDGIVVRENGVNAAQVTVHLDHLFFDSWARDDASLRFDAMAAVAPKAGTLTLQDLAKQDNLSDLKDADGKPLDLAYDPGSAFEPVPENLQQYTEDAATTTGHWNGEGHCLYMRK